MTAYSIFHGMVGREITGVKIDGKSYSIDELRVALSVPAAAVVGEPVAWYREGFTFNFSLGSKRPENNTSNPDEWKPLYAASRISQQDAELERLRREVEEAKEFRAILEGHLSAAIDDYNEARKAAFIEAAEIAEQTTVPNSSGAALGANLRAERIAGALRAKAEETGR